MFMTQNQESSNDQNGNCTKPLLAVVNFFNGYFSTVLSENTS